jgi:rod shape-determining protein MreD
VRRYSLIFIFSVFIILLQQAVVSKLDIFGVGFDLVFVFVICFSLIRDELECVVLALLCGIIRDSFFPSIFGINTVVYLVAAYILSQMQKRIYKDAIIIPAISAFSLTVLKGLLYFAYFYIAAIKFNFVSQVVNQVLLESVYNSLLSLIVYRVVKKLSITKIMQQDWKF